MGYPNVRELNIDSWQTFKKHVDHCRLRWVYRGQSNANWGISSSLFRSQILENFPEYEETVLEEYRRGARHHIINEKEPQTNLEWFSLLQHFGAPTRMIDATFSPYVAAYFAYSDSDGTNDVAIWVIDKIDLFQASNYLFQKNNLTNIYSSKNCYDDDLFEEFFDACKAIEVNCIFPIEPKSRNERQYRQQALFLCQGNPFLSFEDQLQFTDYIERPSIQKWILPGHERKVVMQDLFRMNITAATLFPGLAGYTKSLSQRFKNLVNVAQMGDDLTYLNKNGIGD